MSRQLEQKIEERAARTKASVLLAVYGDLPRAISRAGGELTGFNIKYNPMDCLMVLKAVFPAGPQVAFVTSEDLPAVIVKAVREAKNDSLRWRADRYG
jgi:hypothetical protein